MGVIQKMKQNYGIIFILLIGIFLRFYQLDFQNAWADEVLVLKESEPGLLFREAYDIILLRDSTSFLHVFSIHYLSFLLGHTIWTARLISAIAGVLSILYIYKLGNIMFSRRVGHFAAILLTLNLFHIEYSQEARSYSLLILFVILAFYNLYRYIHNPNFYNALFLGIWMGLTTNAHPIGLLNVASIYIILFLVFLFQKNNTARRNIFIGSAIAGVTTLLLFSFIYPIVAAASRITSFWISAASFKRIREVFTELAGKSEILLLLFILAFFFFTIKCIIALKKNKTSILENKLIFSYIVLFVWLFFEVGVVLIKSYTGISILLSRYLLAVLPAMILIVVFAIDLIKNTYLKYFILIVVVGYSIYNTFYITKYYETVSKAQFKNLSAFINRKNADNDKVVSRFGWVLSYYVNQGNPETTVIENSLDNFIGSMKNQSIPIESFWYFDGNSAEYIVSTENQKFLEENFNLKEDRKMFDCWTKHYVSKNQQSKNVEAFINGEMKIAFKHFKSPHTDPQGSILIFQNSVLKSSPLPLPKGNYTLVLNGNSFPDPPIKGENANLKIVINDKLVGQLHLSEKNTKAINEIKFRNTEDKITVSITYDNDVSIGELDRNVILYSLKIIQN